MLRHKRSPSSIKGFTLIEVMVAIAVFATLSMSAYQVLNQVQRSNIQSNERSARVQQLQRALVFMDNDFRQMVARQFRTNGEEAAKKLLYAEEYLLDSESQAIMFVRLGWQNPQQLYPRGELNKVGYRVIEGQLERVWWRYPDTVTGDKPIITPVIDDVEALKFRFYDGKKWSEAWDQAMKLPRAVGMTITFKDYGDIERIYLVAENTLEVIVPKAESDKGSSDSQGQS